MKDWETFDLGDVKLLSGKILKSGKITYKTYGALNKNFDVSITPINNKTILEIGPGTGNLTSFILRNNPKKVFVIEKDNNLAENLVKTFKDQLTVINDDVLKH